jgi:hypothetical protein
MSSYQTSKREAAHEDSAWSVLWTAGDKIVSGSIDETVKVLCPPRPVFYGLRPSRSLLPLSSLLFLLPHPRSVCNNIFPHTPSRGGCMKG